MSTEQACISVVDDDVLVLKSVGRLLQSVGYAVRTFSENSTGTMTSMARAMLLRR